jgi:hypothetical protein
VTLRNAAFLFAAGWTLFWSSALGVTAFVLIWASLALIGCALGTIPLASRKAKPQGVAAADASAMAPAVKP